MLYCKKLDENAKLPTVSHPGEDLGFDIFSIETIELLPLQVKKVRTGIAAKFIDDECIHLGTGGSLGGTNIPKNIFGLILKDRSSMAAKGITISAGVLDSGYTGEILVLLTNNNSSNIVINKADKIAQMIPLKVNTANGVMEVQDLPESERKAKGFGSSGI